MKRFAFLSAIILSAIIFQGCSKKDDTSNPVNPVSTTPQGTWRISNFFSTMDETGNFAGYIFTFNSAGGVIATKGTLIKNGTWSETTTKFILSFGTDVLFSDLNNDWLKVEKLAASIKLKEDNPAQTDKLEFIRI
ncbi:MAG: hypothetical protein ABIQ56_07520 [Chitinophagaceae bacterium]